MSSMKSWMLGAIVVATGLAIGAVPAQAAEYGFHTRGPVAYAPHCPGPGHAWGAGYRANDYWNPGRWNFTGERERAPFARFEGGRRGRELDRHSDRGHDRFRR